MNRVTAAIRKMQDQIQERIDQGLTTAEAVKAAGRQMDMDVAEYCRFQEAKSMAVASGKLSVEEGMAVYNLLGTSVETFNQQPAAVKVMLTKLFAELLEGSHPNHATGEQNVR